MNFGAWLAHSLASRAYRKGFQTFLRALSEPEETQRNVLRAVLSGLRGADQYQERELAKIQTYEDFRAAIELGDYATHRHWIFRDRAAVRAGLTGSAVAPEVRRFEPTSGSEADRKWIPLTDGFSRELDAALGAWLGGWYRKYGTRIWGKQYWSLSWVPEDLQAETDHNDLELLPRWKRLILQQTMAVSASVTQAPSLGETRRRIASKLATCPDLRVMSFWSPTLGLELMADLIRDREVYARGNPIFAHAPDSVEDIQGCADFFQELWPNLTIVSAWDSSTSAAPAAELRARLSHATFEGKGLWATEGVVTVPFQGRYPAAVTSHFLEFRSLENDQIRPLWELRRGDLVEPLLTTSSGLLRYRLRDRLRVVDFLESTPCFEFLGRDGTTDLVGEKLSHEQLRAIGEREFGSSRVWYWVAVTGTRRRYVLIVQGSEGEAEAEAQTARVEASLMSVHHYRVARELGQLHPAEVKRVEYAAERFFKFFHPRGREMGGALGGHKMELVVTVPDVVLDPGLKWNP